MLSNHAGGFKTLIWVYVKGVSVMINDMLELQVNNQKYFPIGKVLRGLSKAPDAYVMALFDTKLSDS